MTPTTRNEADCTTCVHTQGTPPKSPHRNGSATRAREEETRSVLAPIKRINACGVEAIYLVSQ